MNSKNDFSWKLPVYGDNTQNLLNKKGSYRNKMNTRQFDVDVYLIIRKNSKSVIIAPGNFSFEKGSDRRASKSKYALCLTAWIIEMRE